MRIVFFGDGLWGTQSLQRLIEDGREIVAVVIRTKPTDPGLAILASKHGLLLFQPQQVNDPAFLFQLTNLHCDLYLSVSYDQIFRCLILRIPPFGIVNFHAGKLPYYRGRNVINWAMINGEREIGITAHYVDEQIDTGDIILQRTLPIAWTDTYREVLDSVIQAFPDLVSDTVKQIVDGQVEKRSHSQLRGTYFPQRKAGDEWLDWSDTSHNLYNKIRAITRPGPGARAWLEDKEIIIWRAFYDPGWPRYIANAGQVVDRRPGEGVLIKTGDSTIIIQEVESDQEIYVPNWRIGTRLTVNFFLRMKTLEARLDQLEQTIERLQREKP